MHPISILPVISKILEMATPTDIQQITEYVFAQNIVLAIHSSGFRSNHSTVTALSHAVDDILRNTDNSKVTCLILLDFSKAFDTLDHELLCKELNFSHRKLSSF